MNCEICGKKLDLQGGFFSCPDMERGRWQFVCSACPDGFYDFSTKTFFESPKTIVNWLAHLHEKRWFQPGKFFDLMARLRNG